MAQKQSRIKFLMRRGSLVIDAIRMHGGICADVRAVAVAACQQADYDMEGLDEDLNAILEELSKDMPALDNKTLERLVSVAVHEHRTSVRSLPNGHPDGAWRSPEQFALHMWCEWSKMYRVQHDVALRYIKHEWLKWAEAQKQLPAKRMEYDNFTSLDMALDYVQEQLATCLVDDGATRRHATALVAWMWGVKRRNIGLPNPWPFVLTFMGVRNGTGKTKFVDNLVLPWATLVDRATVPQIVDERHQARMSQQAIVVLDELAGVTKADCNGFKRLITSEKLNVRELYSSEPGEFRMYASFVATSNHEAIADFWSDPSGIRRWYPVPVEDFRKSAFPIDWDSTPLWQMIDPHWDQFFGEDQTGEIIEDHCASDPIEDWLLAAGVDWRVQESERTVAFAAQSRILYKHYKQFAGNKAVSIRVFQRKLRKYIPFKKKKVKGESIWCWCWYVNSSSTCDIPNEA